MKCVYFLALFLIHLFSCSKNDTSIPQTEPAIANTSNRISNQQNRFLKFSDIDSVATFDKSIVDTPIDSISLSSLTFNARYLDCYKANLNINLYNYLKATVPKKYNAIKAITTGHRFLVNDTLYHFNGMHTISCNYPESCQVIIHASIYHLFNSRRGSGNIIIIDSISPSSEKDCGKKLIFADGKALSVSTNYHTENPIDSISTCYNTFTGQLTGWGKGVLPSNNFEFLKTHSPNEYKGIDAITTAYNIRSNNNDFYFNGKSDVGFEVSIGSEVTINALVFSLFHQKSLLSNILIINSMKPVN